MNIFFIIFNCRSLLILLLTKTDVSSRRYRALLMWCLSFVLRNNSSCSSGAFSVLWEPQTQTGREDYTQCSETPLGRLDQSVREPLRGPRGQRPRQSNKTQQRPPLVSIRARWLCKNARRRTIKNCCMSFITRWNRTQWKKERKKEENKM